MKKLTTFALLILVAFTAQATDFYFLGMEDNAYENPANWSPTYPGNVIEENNRVYIQADAYFNNFEVIVKGQMEVVLGATLYGNGNVITVKKGGTFVNNGDSNLAKLENEGKVENGISANLLVESFANGLYGSFFNLKGATFTVNKNLINEGNMQMYGENVVKGNVQNYAQIQVNPNASFTVKGTMTTTAGAAFRSNEKASLAIAKTLTADKFTSKAGRNINYTELMFADAGSFNSYQ
ncbi:MAG: hypothetical protein ACKVTZ_03920 [Bacteroidia bacterium]